MKFEIKNRFTGAVQVTAEIDTNSENANLRLGLAVKWAIKSGVDLGGADLRGAYLRDADLRDAYLSSAYLRGAYLRDADLRDAYLSSAYLRGADLSSADLRGADLSSADLRGANLGEQWIIQGPTRSDGYFFLLTNLKDEGVRLKAGCRNFTLTEARKHWNETRKNTALGNETFAILDCLEKMAIARGLKLD